jgi:hypothetical protein
MQAYILSSLQGPLIVLLNTIFGVKPLPSEQIGIVCAFAGAFLVVIDPLGERVDEYEEPRSVYVSLLVSSVFGSAYLLMNEKQTRAFRICFLMFFQSIQMFVVSSLTAVVATRGKAQIFSTNATWGCLGFLSPDYFVLLILMQGCLSGICGGFGQHICFFFHAPVVT